MMATSSSGTLQDTDLEVQAFSDDSGVDVKPRGHRVSCESGRRNKRKSSEPRRRKDVLLMKRFRWDTDEEDDVFLEGEERPSSGDSGCCPLEEEEEEEDRPPLQEKKKRQRQWRKPPRTTEPVVAPRQSVIRKNENTPCTPVVREPPEPSKEDEDEEPRRSRPRNYKSMSRQRRIEANARERTRVHTISAAFESLRRAVPAYAHNQKLSKLAILRIASAYIVALACLSSNSPGQEADPMADCVERCTRTIQAEGRSRRRSKE